MFSIGQNRQPEPRTRPATVASASAITIPVSARTSRQSAMAKATPSSTACTIASRSVPWSAREHAAHVRTSCASVRRTNTQKVHATAPSDTDQAAPAIGLGRASNRAIRRDTTPPTGSHRPESMPEWRDRTYARRAPIGGNRVGRRHHCAGGAQRQERRARIAPMPTAPAGLSPALRDHGAWSFPACSGPQPRRATQPRPDAASVARQPVGPTPSDHRGDVEPQRSRCVRDVLDRFTGGIKRR